MTSLKNRKKGSMAGKHSEGSYGEKKKRGTQGPFRPCLRFGSLSKINGNPLRRFKEEGDMCRSAFWKITSA